MADSKSYKDISPEDVRYPGHPDGSDPGASSMPSRNDPHDPAVPSQPQSSFTPCEFVPGGVRKSETAKMLDPSDSGPDTSGSRINILSNKDIYSALSSSSAAQTGAPRQVSQAYENQMRFNLEQARIKYITKRGTDQAPEAVRNYMEQRRAFAAYMDRVKSGDFEVASETVTPPAVSQPRSEPSQQGAVFGFTPTGATGFSVANGQLGTASYRFDNPGLQAHREISPSEPLVVTPEYEATIRQQMLWATNKLSTSIGGSDGKPSVLAAEAVEIKLRTDAFLGFQKAKLEGSVVVSADAEKLAPDLQAWQNRYEAHKAFGSVDRSQIFGTTGQSKGVNPNKVTKAAVEETVANIFAQESKLKRDSLTAAYFKQAGDRLSSYNTMVMSSASRKLYQMAQSGDDNSVRTMETGRYYGAAAVGVGLAILDRRLVVRDLTVAPNSFNLQFKRYGTMAHLSNDKLSSVVTNGRRLGREQKAQIKDLSQKVKALDEKIVDMNAKVAADVKAGSAPGVTKVGNEAFMKRLTRLQEERRLLAEQLSTLKKEHTATMREVRKGSSLQKFRKKNHLHDHLRKEALGVQEPRKAMTERDRMIVAFNKESRERMVKKFGKPLVQMPEKDLVQEIKRMRQQGAGMKSRIKLLQGKGSALSQTERKLLSDLLSNHKDLNRQLSKLIGLKKVRADVRTQRNALKASLSPQASAPVKQSKDRVRKKVQGGTKLPKTAKEMDKVIADFHKKSDEKLSRKFGKDLSRMSEKSLAQEVKLMRKQGASLKSQIKLLQSKGSALSQAERKLLSDLLGKRKELNQRLSKLIGLQKARGDAKQVMNVLSAQRQRLVMSSHRFSSGLYALQSFILMPIQRGTETGTQGLMKMAQIASNRYVHIVVKAAFKSSLFLGKASLNLVASGTSFALDNAAFLAKTRIKTTANAVKTTTKKAIKTSVKHSVNAVKRGVSKATPPRIKTAVNQTALQAAKAKSKYDTVAVGIKNRAWKIKNRLANTKVGKAVSAVRRGFSNASQALQKAGALLKAIGAKAALIALGVFLVCGLIGSIAPMLAGGAGGNVIMSPEDSATDKINLAPYAKHLAKEQEEFDELIEEWMDSIDPDFDTVEVVYQTGEINNTKEILSMMAVRWKQDIDPDDNAQIYPYLTSLFHDSHKIITNREEYECGGCVEDMEWGILTDEEGYVIFDEDGDPVEGWIPYMYCPGHVFLKIDVYIYDFDQIFNLDSMGNADANFEAGAKIGNFKITHYCACEICCGPDASGITASGKPVKANHTIAVDPKVIPLGTHVIIDGREYVAEDTGSAIQGNRIDIYMASHSAALAAGVRNNVPVYSAVASGGGYEDSDDWEGWTEDNIEWCKTIYSHNWDELYDFGKYGGGVVGNPESGELVVEGDWVWPVTDTTSSSGFGWRIHPISGEKKFHNGTDIPVGTGTRVHAAGDGTVTDAGYNDSMGNYIFIDHGNGVETRYYHNDKLFVSAGDEVSAGEVISLSGNTGDSTGPHLHFEFRVNGTPIDPRVQYNL